MKVGVGRPRVLVTVGTGKSSTNSLQKSNLLFASGGVAALQFGRSAGIHELVELARRESAKARLKTYQNLNENLPRPTNFFEEVCT